MKFFLIDRVTEFEPAKHLEAVKNLSLAEEYLQDHFPSFPVLPGVLMVEAMIQSAAWLVRASTDFTHSMVVLDEARNVKYGTFFRPGQTMHVRVDCLGQADDGVWKFKGLGQTDGQTCVQGRFTLRATNLADADANLAETDRRIVKSLRCHWGLIAPRAAAVGGPEEP